MRCVTTVFVLPRHQGPRSRGFAQTARSHRRLGPRSIALGPPEGTISASVRVVVAGIAQKNLLLAPDRAGLKRGAIICVSAEISGRIVRHCGSRDLRPAWLPRARLGPGPSRGRKGHKGDDSNNGIFHDHLHLIVSTKILSVFVPRDELRRSQSIRPTDVFASNDLSERSIGRTFGQRSQTRLAIPALEKARSRAASRNPTAPLSLQGSRERLPIDVRELQIGRALRRP